MKRSRKGSRRTVAQQRGIQKQVARADANSGRRGESERPMQAGARRYPEPPFPKQHQPKPGREATLDPAPMYDAPFYRGSDKLKDKVAVVTGADSGIGRAVSLLFAREGADVVALYLSEHADAEVTRQAVAHEGRQCLLIAGDVRRRAFCRRAVARAVEHFGRVDILVNNAAFQVHTADFLDLTEEHFDQTLKTNLYGYFHMAQAAVEHMPRGGAIVNTGSVTGLLGNKDLLDYSMTKGGIHAFTRSLATNLVPKGIRVNAVAPGPVWTPLNPSVGLLWTPCYWAFMGGIYMFHAGYWGPHVGYYGGINYRYGYFGSGFVGGDGRVTHSLTTGRSTISVPV